MNTKPKYYILTPAVGTNETGSAYPAVESYEDYNFSGANSVYNLDYDKFPDFTPDIRFKLAKEANFCDVMGQSTISACGLLISQDVKDVFEQFKLIPHQYYSAHIEGAKKLYYWVHFVWEEGINHLDFVNSKFQINEFGDNLGSIEIRSHKELLDKQTELGFMKMIYNYDTSMINVNYDLFIHPLNKTIYVSNEIFTTLTHKSLKGLHLEEATNLSMR